MWGIIPAAGQGTRIQPLGFSKELFPIGRRLVNGAERPCAVGEFLVDRLIAGGATKLCFVISSGKSDILEYFGGSVAGVPACYVVQPRPMGLCDAIFRALPFVHPDEPVAVGLPDTIWFPADGLAALPDDELSFLLFSVDRPHLFDVVITDSTGQVQRIDVKPAEPASSWIWGAFKMPGRVLSDLSSLWIARDRQDEYLGTLVNAYLAHGGRAYGFPVGTDYVDVGTLDGCRHATQLLERLEAPLLVR
jgi:glucose-1-phosphate thymidylyltransferase